MILWHELKNKLFKQDFFSNKVLLFLTGISFLSNIFVWYLIYNYFRLLVIGGDTSSIPLHYNIYFGIDYLGPFEYIYTLPILGLIIIFINIVLSIILYNRVKILSIFLTVFGLISQLFLFLDVYLIMSFNK